jgi:hypothetical protein
MLTIVQTAREVREFFNITLDNFSRCAPLSSSAATPTVAAIPSRAAKGLSRDHSFRRNYRSQDGEEPEDGGFLRGERTASLSETTPPRSRSRARPDRRRPGFLARPGHLKAPDTEKDRNARRSPTMISWGHAPRTTRRDAENLQGAMVVPGSSPKRTQIRPETRCKISKTNPIRSRPLTENGENEPNSLSVKSAKKPEKTRRNLLDTWSMRQSQG